MPPRLTGFQDLLAHLLTERRYYYVEARGLGPRPVEPARDAPLKADTWHLPPKLWTPIIPQSTAASTNVLDDDAPVLRGYSGSG